MRAVEPCNSRVSLAEQIPHSAEMHFLIVAKAILDSLGRMRCGIASCVNQV
jgi:hypothetical protein